MKKYLSAKAGKHIIDTYDELLKAWDVPFDEINLEGAYGTTHIITVGEKKNPPMVLFHGVGDDAALMWLYNAKALAKAYRLYAVDTLGGPGKSEPGAGYDKQFDDVKWIDELFDGLQLESAVLVGVSHGGYLAQLYTLNRPQRVKRAVCLASTVPVSAGGSPMKTMMKIFMPEALFPTKNNTLRLLRKLSGKNSAAFTDHPLIMEHYRWLLWGFNNMAMGYHKVEYFTDAQVDAIRDKAVYLMGEADPFAKLGGQALLLRYKMHARFFPDVGHGINHEIADEINQILMVLTEPYHCNIIKQIGESGLSQWL
ncbi:MAG: alpha/beta hydrolase [Oscillospiraceae bacterium]|nr:alpha/beta hydrolase [Oscillospiraceae bacterium]